MQKNPIQWSVTEVLSWLTHINCSGAHDIFQYHSIEGKDLIQLTDTDLRFDFKIKRVHDRKYLLRSIQDLKNSFTTIIEVEFNTQHCRIRIPDVTSYTFDSLRKDAARYFGVNGEKSVLKDRKGIVWGNVCINCIFDNNLRQQEPVFLEVIKENDHFDEDSRFQASLHRSESPWLNDESGYFKTASRDDRVKKNF